MRFPPSWHLAACVLAAAAAPAAAETATPPEGVLSLSSSASVEVARDMLSVTFSTSREGSDPTAVQQQLKQALDAALVEARKAARPGQVDVQTGNFALFPRYAPKGGMSGWQGSAELLVEGRDMTAISQLTGRITTLTVARVNYGLSRDVREKAEAEVAAQAIARYRAKAGDYARRFGYAGYAVREISVNGSEAAPIRPMQAQVRAMAGPTEEPLPVEAGKTLVTVGVSGTIQMK